MPAYIVKVTPDDDFYVVWSTITESPYAWGDRAEITEYLLERDQKKPEYAAPEIEERFARADEWGSSSFHGDYRWDDAFFMYEQKGMLPRNRLADFLDSYDEEAHTYDETLLEPFEDDD